MLQPHRTAFYRIAAVLTDPGFVLHEISLLRLRALLARTHKHEDSYRDYRDRYRAMATSLSFEGHMKWADEAHDSLSPLSQPSDSSMASSGLSRSASSIARRRNWRATSARRCSSNARRSSRPMLCASICMVVTPAGLAVSCRHPAVCTLVR